VAESRGRLVGWLHASVHHTITNEISAEIAGLVVDEQVRGTGVGRALMSAAEQWARAQSCESVRLRSNVIRVGAHAFYRRLRYEIIKSQHAFRKKLA
jgi:GNAT superfamily N-acetyltransferase